MEEHGSIKLNHITLINYLEIMGSLNVYFFYFTRFKGKRNKEYENLFMEAHGVDKVIGMVYLVQF